MKFHKWQEKVLEFKEYAQLRKEQLYLGIPLGRKSSSGPSFDWLEC